MSHDPARLADTRGWLAKARADLRAAEHEFQATPPLLDDIVFHCQQAAEKALKGFLAYDWPGNVRELANVIERAVVLGQGPKVELQDLPARVVAHQERGSSESPSYREALNGFRREVILTALTRAQGNRAVAARALGLHEKYLLRLMKSLRIG